MRVLIWCNTYYQLISAVQMGKTIFADCMVDVVISDHSVGASRVAENLRGAHVFEEVIFIQNKNILNGSRKKRLPYFLSAALGKMPSVTNNAYDEIVFYNFQPWLYGIGDCSVRQGKNVRWSRFDEGIFSYDADVLPRRGRLNHILELLRCLTRKYSISNCVSRFYCYFPELKNDSQGWDIKKIPAINSSSKETIEILKHCFDYKEFPYPQKYIFFASAFDFSFDSGGDPFDETKMVLKLAEIVGTDNLLVKMHPRSTKEICRQYGINVMANSEIPWEVIQLCTDITDRVLLAAISGALLSISAMSTCDTKALFLVSDAIEEPDAVSLIQRLKEKLEVLHSDNHAMNVEITSFSEFCDHLKKTQEKNNEFFESGAEGVAYMPNGSVEARFIS